MAKYHTHRASQPASVSLEFDLPAAVLALAPTAVQDLRATYAKAEADLQIALDAVVTPAEVLADNASAIKAAVTAGKKVPPAISEPEAEARAAVSVAKVNDATRAAYAAATAYEAALPVHREAIRAALVPSFREAAAEAAEAQRVADAAKAKRDQALSALDTLDHVAATADQATDPRRTDHRFVNAVSQARTRLGETAAVDHDLLASPEYALALKGSDVVAEVRALRARIESYRNGAGRMLQASAGMPRDVRAAFARLQVLGVSV